MLPPATGRSRRDDFVAEKQILDRVEIVAEREILVNGLDA
jgi:hypothetical protein